MVVSGARSDREGDGMFVIAVHKDGKAQKAMSIEEFAQAQKSGWVRLFTEQWDTPTEKK